MKKNLTFDELDALCERLSSANFKCGDWWPTMSEVEEYLSDNPKKNIEFMIWITETAREPVTDEEKAVKKRLLKMINTNLVIKG